MLQIDTGSLYPTLHKLQKRGWFEAAWKTSENNQRAKYNRRFFHVRYSGDPRTIELAVRTGIPGDCRDRLYAVVAFHTARRTRDFGIRIALGASSQRILGQVLWEGLLLAASGAAIGLVLSRAARTDPMHALRED